MPNTFSEGYMMYTISNKFAVQRKKQQCLKKRRINCGFLFYLQTERLFLNNKGEGDEQMKIRDRGKLKLQPASFLPLAVEMFKDQERIERPILDQYQLGEVEDRICYAMESTSAVKLTIWDDGFTEEVTGLIHYVDLITYQLRIEV